MLDFISVIADIALAIVSVPVSAVLGIWNRRFGRGDSSSDDAQTDHLQSDTGKQTNGHPLADISSSREAPETRSHIPRPTAIQRIDSGSSSRSVPRENGHPITAPVQDRTEMAQKHEIWYPPRSAYEDDDENNAGDSKPQGVATPSPMDSDATLVAVEQVDEWRLYPQFPSAYPPTPLVTLTRLVSKSTNLDVDARFNGSALPEVDEASDQGFRRSLSPPPDATNPGSFGDLSDEKPDSGIHEMKDDDDMTMSDDRDVSMDEDEEDEFNITLQTPVPVRVINETPFHAAKMTSRTTSLATTMSIRSLSTGLSTVDNGSSLRTRSSLDSLSSPAVSSGEDSPVIGKKRPLPASSKVNNRNHKAVIDAGLDPTMTNESIDERHGQGHAPIMRCSNAQKSRGDGNVMFEKRRRVVSPPRIAVRSSKPVRHVRPRLAQAASPPAKSQRPRLDRKTDTGQARPIPHTRTSALRTERWVHGAPNSNVAIGKFIPRRVHTARDEETTLNEEGS